MRRMSAPAYLHTMTLDELMDNVFEGKSAVIENLLYTGAYICRSAQIRQVHSAMRSIPTLPLYPLKKSSGIFRFVPEHSATIVSCVFI